MPIDDRVNPDLKRKHTSAIASQVSCVIIVESCAHVCERDDA